MPGDNKAGGSAVALRAWFGVRIGCMEAKPCQGLRGGWAKAELPEADACLDGRASWALPRAARWVVVWGCTMQSLPTAEAAPGAAPTTRRHEEAARLCAHSVPVAAGVSSFQGLFYLASARALDIRGCTEKREASTETQKKKGSSGQNSCCSPGWTGKEGAGAEMSNQML